jgi:hypothetical protein
LFAFAQWTMSAGSLSYRSFDRYTGDFVMLFLIVVFVILWLGAWCTKTRIFFFAQYYTDYDIYIFWSSASWCVLQHGSVLRLELSHRTIGAVLLNKNFLNQGTASFSTTKHRATNWRSLFLLEWIIISNDYIFFFIKRISCFLLNSAKLLDNVKICKGYMLFCFKKG